MGAVAPPERNLSRNGTDPLTDRDGIRRLLWTVLLPVVLTAGCTTKTAQTAPPIMAAPVRVAKASQRSVPIDLTAIGTGEAYSTVSIKSQVNAELEQVHFQQGDFVTKGELLFTLDARPLM